jgi:heme-degrading monooxygenase HmoA
MFISQVTYESAKTNDGHLKGIMKKKAAAAASVAGLVSFECWVSETPETIAYTQVVKWESQEHFATWMRDIHGKEHHAKDEHESSPITKRACHYTLVDIAAL